LKIFEWIMGINFWGVVHGTQAFLPYLHASGEGHVINLSSLFGLMAMPTQSTYNASKFAVRGYTEALRMELELEGAPVSATSIHPGGVATNIVNASRIDQQIVDATGQDEETHRRRANRLINVTTPDTAALQILAGVERNARRVLVGKDAWVLDKVIRLLGSAYQLVVLRRAREMLGGGGKTVQTLKGWLKSSLCVWTSPSLPYATISNGRSHDIDYRIQRIRQQRLVSDCSAWFRACTAKR
jgi:short-subunit dehydrogenase